MSLDIGYDKRYPSEKNFSSFITLYIHDIVDMNELHMSYIVNFQIHLKWYDPRINFRNLKTTDNENKLDILEIERIWTPKLFIYTYISASSRSAHFPIVLICAYL